MSGRFEDLRKMRIDQRYRTLKIENSRRAVKSRPASVGLIKHTPNNNANLFSPDISCLNKQDKHGGDISTLFRGLSPEFPSIDNCIPMMD